MVANFPDLAASEPANLKFAFRYQFERGFFSHKIIIYSPNNATISPNVQT